MKTRVWVWAVVLLAVPGLHPACRCAALEDARKIIEANKQAVVTVQFVVETSFPGESEKEESKGSATGTVIDPSGLVVASLSELDPARGYADFMFVFEGSGRKPQSNITDAKIRTDDGTEIPVDVVLRDQDLDLVFLRPKNPVAKALPFIDLSQESAPQVLDEVVVLWRLGQVANRALAADIARIQAVVTRPRLSYAIDVQALGCPAFTLDGKVVGISVLRRSPQGASRDEMFSFSNNWLTMILPCSTVAKAAQQAKQAKPEKAPQTAPAKPSAQPSSAKPPAKAK